MNKIKPMVSHLLLTVDETRDDDNLLIANIWKKQIMLNGGGEFFEHFLTNKLASAETIRRTRQRLQEQNIGLRGKKYNQRKGIVQEQVVKSIKLI